MQPIPTPQLLDPDRIRDSHRIDAHTDYEELCQLLDDELHHSCAYARQLWHDLDDVRAYLLDSLPPDSHSLGSHAITATSPTGPDDDTGWNQWITAYAAVTSILCGPHGDSGFGLGEARREAALRRSAPAARNDADRPVLAAALPTQTAPPEKASAPNAPGPPGFRAGRAAATAVLILLAVRGLRPHHRADPR